MIAFESGRIARCSALPSAVWSTQDTNLSSPPGLPFLRVFEISSRQGSRSWYPVTPVTRATTYPAEGRRLLSLARAASTLPRTAKPNGEDFRTPPHRHAAIGKSGCDVGTSPKPFLELQRDL